jgi:hypothetical protein
MICNTTLSNRAQSSVQIKISRARRMNRRVLFMFDPPCSPRVALRSRAGRQPIAGWPQGKPKGLPCGVTQDATLGTPSVHRRRTYHPRLARS